MIQQKAKKVLKQVNIRLSKMVLLNDSNEVDVLRCNIANMLDIPVTDVTFKYSELTKEKK